jgi:hypothetical protein
MSTSPLVCVISVATMLAPTNHLDIRHQHEILHLMLSIWAISWLPSRRRCHASITGNCAALRAPVLGEQHRDQQRQGPPPRAGVWRNNGTKSGGTNAIAGHRGCAQGGVLTLPPASTSPTGGADQHRCIHIQYYRHFSFRCSSRPEHTSYNTSRLIALVSYVKRLVICQLRAYLLMWVMPGQWLVSQPPTGGLADQAAALR